MYLSFVIKYIFFRWEECRELPIPSEYLVTVTMPAIVVFVFLCLLFHGVVLTSTLSAIHQLMHRRLNDEVDSLPIRTTLQKSIYIYSICIHIYNLEIYNAY